MDFYNEIAKSYNELHGDEQKRKAKLILEQLKVSKSDSLLDVGCGTGIATELFPCRKTGVDPAFELLKQCKFPTVQGTAESLPFSDNSFDIVVSITAVHHCNDLAKAVREMVRVAKRDIVITVLRKSPKFKEIETAISAHYPYLHIVDKHDVIYFIRKPQG